MNRPYGSAAFKYVTAGWKGPLPVGHRPHEKDPPPPGYTGGNNGHWPNDDQVAEWVKTRGDYNIALRLPNDVVGIDLDVWKGDSFRETAEAITAVHGKLPRTWMSTSRSDRSGIRLFRLPDGVDERALAGTINHPDGGDRTAGEVIRCSHRYAMVPPSIHPDTGETYRWIDQTSGEVSDRVPRPSELPELPPEWIDHLRGECSCFFWLKIRMSESKDPVAEAFNRWHSKLVSGTYSRHDAACGGSMALVAFRYRNWPGADEHLKRLEATFMAAAMTGEDARTNKKAADEWRRMIVGAEKQAPSTRIPPYEQPREKKKPKPEATKPEGRRILLTPATDIELLPIRWVWEERIPMGEICLTPGLANVGKSTFHSWVMAHITRGTLPGVHYGTPKPVIICAHEDSWERSIAPRLVAAGADLDLVYRAEVITDDDQRSKLTLPADNELLETEIVRLGVALVSIDPLLSSIDRDLDSYKGREVREALEPLQHMADKTRCVILANAHFNKATGTDPLLRITGSTAFGEVCRAALAFAFDTDNSQFVISQAKNSLGRTHDLPNLTYRLDPVTIPTKEGDSVVVKLVFTGESARSVREILNPRNDPDKGARDVAKDVILDQLALGPQSWEDILKVLSKEDVSPRTGQRARDELRKAGLVSTGGGGGLPWRWQLSHVPGEWLSGQHGQEAQPTEEELSHPVANTFPNDDAYLANLANNKQTLREGASKELCSDCQHPIPGQHFFNCPSLADDGLTNFGGRR